MERAGTNGHVVDSRARGSNQSGLRAHNERAVLSLIRRYGELAKADIARRTGLSAQTASVIMRALEAEELVIREKPRRGRVGQPSVPMRLNPDGALSLGLKIGRRSSELVLMDFIGRIRASERRTYAYPMVEDIRDFVSIAFERLVGDLDGRGGRRGAGGVVVAAGDEHRRERDGEHREEQGRGGRAGAAHAPPWHGCGARWRHGPAVVTTGQPERTTRGPRDGHFGQEPVTTTS